MNPRRTQIALLLLAISLVDLAVWTAGSSCARPPLAHRAVLLAPAALASSQVSLLAIWVALGPALLSLRLVVLVAGLALANWGLNLFDPHSKSILLFFLAAQAAFVVIGLLVLRAAGWRKVDMVRGDSGRAAELQKRPPQFSLAQCLLVFTATGLLLATVRDVNEWLDYGDVIVVCVAGGFSAAAVILVTCLALGRGRPGLQTALALMTCLLLAGMMPVVSCGGSAFDPSGLGVLLALPLLLIGAVLLVFRVCGYRLVRCKQESRRLQVN